MRRRDFITPLGGAAAAWPLVARAQQQPAMTVIGLLAAGVPEFFGNLVTAFQQGLNETGYIEGQSVAVEYRWAGISRGRVDLMPELVLTKTKPWRKRRCRNTGMALIGWFWSRAMK